MSFCVSPKPASLRTSSGSMFFLGLAIAQSFLDLGPSLREGPVAHRYPVVLQIRLLEQARGFWGTSHRSRGKTGLTTQENECEKGKLRLRENRRCQKKSVHSQLTTGYLEPPRLSLGHGLATGAADGGAHVQGFAATGADSKTGLHLHHRRGAVLGHCRWGNGVLCLMRRGGLAAWLLVVIRCGLVAARPSLQAFQIGGIHVFRTSSGMRPALASRAWRGIRCFLPG